MGRTIIRGLRWWIIGVVMIGTSLNYLTRSTGQLCLPI
jgi:ACS family hexuronate transporter-like MFS transporter